MRCVGGQAKRSRTFSFPSIDSDWIGNLILALGRHTNGRDLSVEIKIEETNESYYFASWRRKRMSIRSFVVGSWWDGDEV